MKYLIAIAILGFIAWRVAGSENPLRELMPILLLIGFIGALPVLIIAERWWLKTLAGIVCFGVLAVMILGFVRGVIVPAFVGNFLPIVSITALGCFAWALSLRSTLKETVMREKDHSRRLAIVIRCVSELEKSRDKDMSYQAGLLNERLRVEVERETILHPDFFAQHEAGLDRNWDAEDWKINMARREKMEKALGEIEGKVATLWGIAQRSDDSPEPTEPDNVPEYIQRAEKTARVAIGLMTHESRSISDDARLLVDRLESEQGKMLKKEKVTKAFKKIEEKVTALANKAREINEGHTE